jgi:hypothetical protein
MGETSPKNGNKINSMHNHFLSAYAGIMVIKEKC